MNIYRIHHGRLSSHQNSELYFLRHSIRDHDLHHPMLAEVKQWCLAHAVDHHFEVRPVEGDAEGRFYTALVLNNPTDAVALRLQFGHKPGDSLLFDIADQRQKETWKIP